MHNTTTTTTANSTESNTDHRQYDQWMCWVPVGDKKIPLNPKNADSSWSDPANWMSYVEARTFAEERDNIGGIGFVLTKSDPFICWDFDDVRDEQGNIAQWATKAINRLDSYTEYSPSKTGFHTLTCGVKPGTATVGKQDDGSKVEVFDSTFVTVTEDIVEGNPTAVEERQEAIDDVYGALVGDITEAPKDGPSDGFDGVSRSDVHPSILRKAEQFDLVIDGYDMDKVETMRSGITNFYGMFETTNRARHFFNGVCNGNLCKWDLETKAGRGDRSKATVFIFDKLLNIVRLEDIDTDCAAHYLEYVCEQVPETADGQPRKWATRGESWRRGVVISVLGSYDKDKFRSWQRNKYDPGDDPTITDRTRRDRTGEPAALTQAFARSAVFHLCERETRNYPSSDAIATLAHRADPSRSVSYYKQVVSYLVNERAILKRGRTGRYDNRYYPRSWPDPEGVDAISMGQTDITDLDRSEWPNRESVPIMEGVSGDVSSVVIPNKHTTTGQR